MKLFIFLSLLSGFLLAEPQVRVSVAAPEEHFVLIGDQGEKSDVQAAEAGIILNGKQSGKSRLEIKANLIEVNSKKFRNHLEVILKSNKLILIHTLPMESYIAGVISSELPASWPLEVLKAQAIAARTYALWQLSKKKHLEASVLDQVYFGVQREHKMALQAAQETAGKVLTYESKPIHAYFHACCGGHTASAKEVFGTEEPYLQGVSCPYCHKAPSYKWTYSVSRRELNKKLGVDVKKLESTGETNSGRVLSFQFKSRPVLKEMKSAEFRKNLGYNNLKSTLLTKYSLGWSRAEFAGRGHGHGVGMCQWGALGMAQQNKKAEAILDFYYPGTEIRKFY